MESGLLAGIEILISRGKYRIALDRLMDVPHDFHSNDYYHLLLGACWFELKDFKKALASIETSISIHPTSHLAFIFLALIARMEGDLKKAESHINEAIRLEPKNEQAYMVKAGIQLLNHQTEAALESANKGLEIAPDDIFLRNIIILGKIEKNDLEQAQIILESVLHQDPNDAFSLANLGYIQLQQGDKDSARSTLENALRTDPENEYAQHILGMVLSAKYPLYLRLNILRTTIQKNINRFKQVISAAWRIVTLIMAIHFLVADPQPMLYLTVMVAFYLIISIPIKWVSVLPQLFLIWEPLGRLLMNKKDRILTYVTYAFLALGILIHVLHVFQKISHILIWAISLLLIYSGFSVMELNMYPNKSVRRFFIFKTIFLFILAIILLVFPNMQFITAIIGCIFMYIIPIIIKSIQN